MKISPEDYWDGFPLVEEEKLIIDEISQMINHNFEDIINSEVGDLYDELDYEVITELVGYIAQNHHVTGISICNKYSDSKIEVNEIPGCIQKLPNLQILSIGDQPICEIPEWIANLKQLIILEIFNCKIRDVPFIYELPNLLPNLKILNIDPWVEKYRF